MQPNTHSTLTVAIAILAECELTRNAMEWQEFLRKLESEISLLLLDISGNHYVHIKDISAEEV